MKYRNMLTDNFVERFRVLLETAKGENNCDLSFQLQETPTIPSTKICRGFGLAYYIFRK